MSSAEDLAAALAQRLRELREKHWPGRLITQAQLADALSGRGTLSVPSISSWENQSRPTVPPLSRLRAYALFFATERSVEHEPYRLLDLASLTSDERAVRDRLLAELTGLRNAAKAARAGIPMKAASSPNPGETSLLRFRPGENIVIVCAPLPAELRQKLPYPDSADPDYVDLYNYTDIDALMELYGRLSALNPDSTVKRVLADQLTPEDYVEHLILLGGVDWNVAVRDLANRTTVPVRQVTRIRADDLGWFEADSEKQSDEPRRFEPKFKSPGDTDGRRELVEDVAHFYYGPSPYYEKRTVMSFNGMYTRGTYGAVRALTDINFRAQNEAYVRKRFAGYSEWSLLTKVVIVDGQALTPAWSLPHTRLHVWQAAKADEGQDARG